MSVYVDVLMHHGWQFYGRPTKTCHMFADSEHELRDIADEIGCKQDWACKRGDVFHFDLTEGKQIMAVHHGAVKLSSKESVLKMRGILGETNSDDDR